MTRPFSGVTTGLSWRSKKRRQMSPTAPCARNTSSSSLENTLPLAPSRREGSMAPMPTRARLTVSMRRMVRRRTGRCGGTARRRKGRPARRCGDPTPPRSRAGWRCRWRPPGGRRLFPGKHRLPPARWSTAHARPAPPTRVADSELKARAKPTPPSAPGG